ncbi:MAG: hypothetical protein RR214_08790, partial [Synergistaceae bacterium]
GENTGQRGGKRYEGNRTESRDFRGGDKPYERGENTGQRGGKRYEKGDKPQFGKPKREGFAKPAQRGAKPAGKAPDKFRKKSGSK